MMMTDNDLKLMHKEFKLLFLHLSGAAEKD